MRASRDGVRLELLPGYEEAREDWSLLAERSGNVFATWEWAHTWWRHFGRERPLLLTLCRDAREEPLALLPLYESSSRPLRIIRFIGHGAGDQLGPVCAPADRARAASSLKLALAERVPSWDLLLAERLPGDGEWERPLGAPVLRREDSPVIEIEGTSWDDFLASRSPNFRSQVRRKERKLAREHSLLFRLSDDPARLGDDLEKLFELHEARWGEAGSGALSGARAAFHRDFAPLALERGWLRLWIAEVDGTPVAAWYGFRFGGTEWYYQSGRDPAWDGSSVGLVLLAHTVREAINDGMREYRLLRGGEAYKSRFATSDPGLETLVMRRGILGRAAAGGSRLVMSLPAWARRWLTASLD